MQTPVAEFFFILEAMEASSGRLKYKCKVVLLGEQSVGKSSIALRFVYHQFVENHAPTIGGEKTSIYNVTVGISTCFAILLKT